MKLICSRESKLYVYVGDGSKTDGIFLVSMLMILVAHLLCANSFMTHKRVHIIQQVIFVATIRNIWRMIDKLVSRICRHELL